MKQTLRLLLGAALAVGALPGCAPELRLAGVCGDGVVDSGEGCDDANAADGDGCGAACGVEAGYACTGAPSACATVCGDGVVAGPGECEGTDLGGQTCEGLGFQSGTLACDASCAVDTSGCVPNEDCNNGVDDDQDGSFDCADTDCASQAPCSDGGEVVCDDIQDNDEDLFLDCEDTTGCQALAMCNPGATAVGGPCSRPNDCQTNGRDPFCIGQANFENWLDGYCSEFCSLAMPDCPEGALCFDAGLQSGNGLCLAECTGTDDCRAGYSCNNFGARMLCWPGGEICDNMVDDENDGLVDCQDPQCRTFASCAVCGDGLQTGEEQCDDGGGASGDGCSADCLLEGPDEIEPNNDCLSPHGPLDVPSVVKGTVGSSDQFDIYIIDVPARADLRLEVYNGGGCDAYLSWDDQSCGSFLYGACDEINAELFSGLSGVDAGIYYLRVNWNFGQDMVPYTLHVTYDALCGNGVVEGSEECDGPDDCTAACKRPTQCGDGQIEGNEQCDDGDSDNGDNCNSSCQLVENPETEPNNTCALSNGLFGPDFMVSGSIAPAGESDYYAIILDEVADLRIETFGAGGPGTCGGDTVIELTTGNACSEFIAYNDQGFNGTTWSDCSLIEASQNPAVHNLMPGTYFVRVWPWYQGVTFDYTMVVSKNTCGDKRKGGIEECDGEPNCAPDCTLITTCGDGKVEGDEQCEPPDVTTCDLSCKYVQYPESTCNDLWDEDGDGLTDCEDPSDCKDLPICTPGNSPVGEPCSQPSDCQANNGDPICYTYTGSGDGYCSEFCNAADDDCPAGSICIDYWWYFPSGSGMCMKTCATDADCSPGSFCYGDFCGF